MTRQMDIRKRQAWSERLRRYRESGLSVKRFCAQEHVAVCSFYYWSKRLATSDRDTGTTITRQRQTSSSVASSMRPDGKGRERSDIASRGARPLRCVRVDLGSGVRLSVPADCEETLERLVCWLVSAARTAAQPSAFQQVIVRSH